MDEITNLLNLFKELSTVQEPKETHLTFGNYNVYYKADENGVSIEIYTKDEESKESFDDSEIKEKISNYKECIEALDDNIFLDILEEMREEIDIKEMDELLALETFTEEDAVRVEQLIEHSSIIVQRYLQNKIQDYMEYYELFQSNLKKV